MKAEDVASWLTVNTPVIALNSTETLDVLSIYVDDDGQVTVDVEIPEDEGLSKDQCT